jgi:hypothetical protein
MQFKIKGLQTWVVLAFLLAFASSVSAQQQGPPKKLKVPSVTVGTIGGESIAHYVFHARKGQVLHINFTWKHEDDNRAEFSVSRSAQNFKTFGHFTGGGKNWTGKAPRAGNYYIDVTAFPMARYTLRLK